MAKSKSLLGNTGNTAKSSITSSATINGLGVASSIPIYSANSGTLSIGNGYSTTYSTPSYSSIFKNEYDFDTKTIDIEKLSNMEESRKKMIFDLLTSFLNCSDTNSKKLIYNTLESYSIIIEKKSLDRKVKISNLTKTN